MIKPSTHMDQLGAEQKALSWFQELILKHNLKENASSEIRHENIQGEGLVSSLWVANRPIATAVMLRDAFNYTILICHEVDWKNSTPPFNFD
jgi:hypothetical protein